MKTSLKHVVKEFQRIHTPVKAERKHNYKIDSVGECTSVKSIEDKDGICFITSSVMVMLTAASCQEILKIFNLDTPTRYTASKMASTSTPRRSYGKPLQEVYCDKKHYYRIPDFDFVCAYLVEHYDIPQDSKFIFSEGSYRRNGSFYNRIIRVDIELTEIGVRKFLIDEFLHN